jgi:hypothetical protein
MSVPVDIIEHMFEYGGMQTASALLDGVGAPDSAPVRRQPVRAARAEGRAAGQPAAGQAAAAQGAAGQAAAAQAAVRQAAVDHVGEARAALERITALRSRISDMEAVRVDVGALPTSPAISPLLPGGTIRAGAVYSVQESMLLVMAMLQAASASGAWCAVIGVPSFGAESAAAAGIDLERLVLVPEPDDQWLAVTAALADIATVVVTRPLGRVTPGNASRLAARLRQRGAALVALGDWPGSEVTLRVTERSWQGIGTGYGFVGECRAVVSASGRAGAVRPMTAELLLPASDGSVRLAEPAGAGRAQGGAGGAQDTLLDDGAIHDGSLRGHQADLLPVAVAS